MSLNIFITGGYGFIGSYLVKDLLKCGHKVICLKRKYAISKDNKYGVKEILKTFDEINLNDLKDIDVVDNIRGYGMMGGVDIVMDKKPGAAGLTCFKHCYEAGVNFKATGDCLIIAPMFICEKKHIDEIIEKLRTGITNYAKSKKN